MTYSDLIAGLPGEEIIRRGILDLREGKYSIPACLVAVARSRFTEAGLLSPRLPREIREPELQLYGLLREEPGDAYSRYNALLRELASFENALEQRIRRRAMAGCSDAA